MLKAVTVINYQGDALRLELTRPELSGIYIKSISGIGPPSANVSITDIATIDGGYYNSARAQTRNIVFELGFYDEPYDLIEDVRHLTYKYFPVKKLVTLVFETDNRTAAIDGYVESNEPNVFSKEEGCQVSIICPYPYFKDYGTANRTVEFSSIASEFEFQMTEQPYGWSNEFDPSEADTLHRNTEFSQIITYNEYNIKYTGDVETGFSMKIHLLGSVGDFTIYDINSGESMKFNLSNITTQANDDIVVSTVRGSKTVRLLRNGVYQNILNVLDRSSEWLTLSYGDNLFAYTAESGLENLAFSITFDTFYEGV